VKLLLNITDKATTLKKLTVEGDEHFRWMIFRKRMGKFVYNDDIVDMRRAKELIAGSTAYIAVEKDYGGIEKAVFVSVKNSKDSEAPVLNDSIMSATFGNKGEFTLKKEYLNISYGNGTIIVKDNRLVTGNSINSEDVKIDDKTDSNFFTIYRGRIAKWNYYNTPDDGLTVTLT